VDLVRAWLSIARTGASAPFEFAIDVDEGAGEARLPPMMLLPLAERMLQGSAATRVALSVKTAADRLGVRIVVDRLRLLDDDKMVSALRERLFALFGDQATLGIAAGPDGTSQAVLDIPFEPTGFAPGVPSPA
jgi:LytS/YehU family sensor histidine kinase